MEDFTTQQEETAQPRENLKTKATKLKASATEYVATYKELAKAKATKAASNTAAGVAVGIASLVLGIFFLAFLFTGLAWWLSSVFESNAAGFFSVAGLFLLLLLLLFALRRKVIVPAIRNMIIKKVYE